MGTISPSAGPVTGAATDAATAACAGRFARLARHGYAPLGATGLTVSRLGFGGYRVDDQTPEHRAALEEALARGVNLIDTSTNYTDGASERLIGAVVADLVRAERLRRAEVVVVSKIGYVQGQNLALAEEREAAGRPFPELVRYAPGVWHCIHPEFLEDQLGRSLARLRLGTLDVCLLHNPEYFLADAAHRGAGPLAAVRDEFYARLARAFGFLEAQVAGGALRWYGVSSNTVAHAVDHPEATSLARMLAAARAAGGAGHHFRVLQLPLNLLESGGARERNNPPDAAPAARRTVLELARAEGVGVLVNRPLNAAAGRGMLRLADVTGPAEPAPLERQVPVVAALEAEYRRLIAPHLRVGAGREAPEDFLRWADQLGSLRGRLGGLAHWEQIEGQVRRLVGQVVGALDGALGGALAAQWREWRDRYVPELDRLLDALRAEAAARSQRQAAAVSAAIDPWLPPDRRAEPLSRKALWVVASTPGVSTVLVGMRRPAYVDDAAAILAWPPLEDPGPVYQAVAAMRSRGT